MGIFKNMGENFPEVNSPGASLIGGNFPGGSFLIPYLKSFQTSMMDLFGKKVNVSKPLIIFRKSFIIDI